MHPAASEGLVNDTDVPAARPPLDHQRRWLIAILAVAVVLRVVWALYATKEPTSWQHFGDGYSYYFHGKELSTGHGYVSYTTHEPTAYWPIGYPAILAALFWFVGHTPLPDELPLAGGLLQAFLGALSVALVFFITQRLFDTRVGLVAAALTAVFPNLIFYVSIFQLETVFIFLVLATIAVIVTHDWSAGPPSRYRLLTFGAVLGLSCLVRPFSLPLLPALGVSVWVGGGSWRSAMRCLAWPALALLLVLAPWTVRNLVVMDSPIMFSTNMGDTLCQDRSLDATGTFSWAPHCQVGYEDVAPEDLEVRHNAVNTRRAITFVREHPRRELLQIARRARYLFQHDHDGLVAGTQRLLGHRLSTMLTQTADWFFYLSLAVGAIGLLAFFRGRQPMRLFVALALLSLLAQPLLLWGTPRFHVPALPLIAIAAAVTLTALWHLGRAPRPTRQGSLASPHGRPACLDRSRGVR